MELAKVSNATRYVGIRHCIKKTADQEARPTQLVLLNPKTGKVTNISLEVEDDELDFVKGQLPITWRTIHDDEKVESFPAHHIKWRTLKKGELPDENTPENHIHKDGKIFQIAEKVSDKYEGLKPGDAVAMVLGGSGNYFAYALSRTGENIGASVHRIPGYELKKARGGQSDDKSKDGDDLLLAKLLQSKPELFRLTTARDRDMITVTRKFMLRQDVMRQRVACMQRLRQRGIGITFCSPDGIYPEGGLEKQFDDLIASDVVYQALTKEHRRLTGEMENALQEIPLFTEILSKVTGVGPAIAGRLVVAIGDIRRFATDAKLKAFCGVHVLSDGSFARRRVGVLCNWNTEARQALFLVGDQFNRRPASVWGQRLLLNKRKLRETHPVVIEMNNEKGKKVKRYTDGHIHKMAIWKTLNQFTRWLWKQGMRLENGLPLNFDLPV
jgi:hypothetical protein